MEMQQSGQPAEKMVEWAEARLRDLCSYFVCPEGHKWAIEAKIETCPNCHAAIVAVRQTMCPVCNEPASSISMAIQYTPGGKMGLRCSHTVGNGELMVFEMPVGKWRIINNARGIRSQSVGKGDFGVDGSATIPVGVDPGAGETAGACEVGSPQERDVGE